MEIFFIFRQATVSNSFFDVAAFVLFPFSWTKKFTIRFFMFVLSERLWLYVLPLIGMVITIFYLNSNVGVVALTICVFLVGYFAISLLFFLLMLILRTAVKKLGLLLTITFSTFIFIILTAPLVYKNEFNFIEFLLPVSVFRDSLVSLISFKIKDVLLGLASLLLFISLVFPVSLISQNIYYTGLVNVKKKLSSKFTLKIKIQPHFDKHQISTFTKIAEAFQGKRYLNLIFTDAKLMQRSEKILFVMLFIPLFFLLPISILNLDTMNMKIVSMAFVSFIFIITYMFGSLIGGKLYTTMGIRFVNLIQFPNIIYPYIVSKNISILIILVSVNLISIFCGYLYFKPSSYVLVFSMLYSLFLSILTIILLNFASLKFIKLSATSPVILFVVFILEILISILFIILTQASIIVGFCLVTFLFIAYYLLLRYWSKLLERNIEYLFHS
ncbi:hypothetical protein [Candidatus Kryptonium thompsonii]|nr:hypothetical protein [Candidatus Kryptonium thompsoni]